MTREPGARAADGMIADGAVADPTGDADVARSRYPWPAVAAMFLLVTAMLTAVVAVVDARTGARGHTGLHWLDGWFRYDSGWYEAIATHGYSYTPGQQSSIAFFPVYPMLVRVLAVPVGDVQVAGQALALASGLCAVLLLGHWAWQRLPRRSAVLAIAVVLAYPYTLFLHGPMYADGLFLALAVAAFLLVDRRWFLAAGVVGALAVATRPFGIAVAVGLVVRTLELLARDAGGTGWRDVVAAVRRVRLRHAGVLLAFGGLAAWMVYLGTAFGDPLAFVADEASPGWNQGVGPRTWLKVAYFGFLLHGHLRMWLSVSVQALACLLVVLLVPRVARRFGLGYAFYTVVVIAIPILGTKDFLGAGRYALAAFPALVAGGDWLAGRSRRLIGGVLAVMGVLLVVLTWYLAKGVEVA